MEHLGRSSEVFETKTPEQNHLSQPYNSTWCRTNKKRKEKLSISGWLPFIFSYGHIWAFSSEIKFSRMHLQCDLRPVDHHTLEKWAVCTCRYSYLCYHKWLEVHPPNTGLTIKERANKLHNDTTRSIYSSKNNWSNTTTAINRVWTPSPFL